MRLKAENISFRYPCGHNYVLKDVDFEVESGEIVGLSAPSGYGKSTLGRILAGYEEPEKGGAVTLDGKPLPKNLFNPVQLIFQHPEKAVNPKWKMKKILAESGTPPTELISAMGIQEGWMDRWPAELSGGELQRFCVLRALTPKTRFLIADEMTTMLDAVTQAQIWQVVLAYAKEQGMGIVVISHERALMERLCGRIVDLEQANSPV